jgi:hypothetical protein
MMMNPKLKKLPKGWDKILADQYLNGASDVEVRAELKMTQALWDALYRDATSSEFKELVDFGRMLAKAWWMRQARESLHKPRSFNANLWLMVMKNQYGYSDRTEVTTKAVQDMSGEDLDQRLREAVTKFVKTNKA